MKKSIWIILLTQIVIALFISSCNKNNSEISSSDSDSIVYADKIIEQIKNGNSIFLHGKKIVGNFDFTKVASANKNLVCSTVYIDQEVIFQNCTFLDSVTSFHSNGSSRQILVSVFNRNVIFEECTFEKCVDFSQSDFKSRFTFDLSKTLEDANFNGTNFNAYTSFNSVNFDGNVSFVSSAFGARVNFMKTLCKKSCIFQFVRFSDISMFMDMHFYGYTEFSKIIALTDLDFTNTQFLDRAVFSFSQYFNGLRMPKCKFAKQLQMEENSFLGEIKMNKAEFSGVFILKSNVFAFYPKMDDVVKSDSLSIDQSDNKISTLTTNINIFNIKQ